MNNTKLNVFYQEAYFLTTGKVISSQKWLQRSMTCQSLEVIGDV